MDNKHLGQGVSVLVPVYNERGAISKTINSLLATLEKVVAPWEILIIDDGSSDGSTEIIENMRRERIAVIHHAFNRGYGASLKTGIKAARYPWILITDADGTYPVDRIPDLLAHIHDHDMVVGARTSDKVHDTIPRMIGRGIVRRFASYITGADIKDINSGLRIFKKEDAEKFWHLFPEGFSFTSTITVASHHKGHRIKYLPIEYYKRAGTSSIKPAKDFTSFLSLLTRLALYYRPLKVFVPASIGLFVLAWAILLSGLFLFDTVMDATFAIFIIASIQTLFFGLLADMIVKRFYND